MEIAHPHAVLRQIVGEIFGHALGERGHEHPLPLICPDTDFAEQVIHLAVGGAYLHHRIEHAGGANHLLHHLAIALAKFPVARCGTHEDRLPRLLPELHSFERTIIGS